MDRNESFNITTRQRGDVTVIDSEGRIDLYDGGAGSLRDTIVTLIGDRKNKILINFAETSFVDSSGVGELVSGFTTLKALGGQLKLLNLTKRVKDLLQTTKLYTVFEVFDNEDDAVRSFDDMS